MNVGDRLAKKKFQCVTPLLWKKVSFSSTILRYFITAPLHDKKTGAHPERVLNIRSWVDKYNWNGSEFSLKPK